MVRPLRSLLVLLSVVLLVASCGSGGSEADAKPYVDAMVKSMVAEEDSPMNEKQARCFSEGFVDVVGLDKIKKAGSAKEFADETDELQFDGLDLTREQGGKIYDRFDKCGVDLRAALLEDMADDETMSAKTKTCVEDALDDDKLRDFFITLMISGPEATQKDKDSGNVMRAVTACLMGNIGGTE